MKPTGLKQLLQFLVALTLSSALIYSLNTRISSIPPLGKFLDPAKGVWQTALIEDIPTEDTLQIPGLSGTVTLVYNERGVPHIFAENDRDLYLAQGYVVARHRFWQMEFSTHAAAGRISEIVGPQALGYDKHQRKIGMTFGAQNSLAAIMEDPKSREILEAYSDGVNAWVNQLDESNMPFEYKLLDYRPEPWSPLKTAIFFMNMNQTLSFRSDTYALTRLREAFGKDLIEILYPNTPEISEPIVSNDRVWDFEVDLPDAPESDFIPKVTRNEFDVPEPDPGIGSNNWAVSGSRTASGYPMLASDPHLTLSLPSIWYEIQLNAPGLNTYGVTLPGVPGIIIGFNQDVSWGVTNTGGFALDLFEVQLNEDRTQYYHDGQWKPVRQEVQTYKVRGSEPIVDTLYYTHHGPVSYLPEEFPSQKDSSQIRTFSGSTPVGQALQWIAHQPSNPMKTFYLLNRATNFEEFEEAVSHFATPAQNFAFAAHDGDIAMKISGRHPVRWIGQGKYISDGSDPRYDWTEYIPHDQVPWERNPVRGFISSANQEPAGPAYPHFIGRGFSTPPRAILINRTLENFQNATHQDMIDLQLNSENYWAKTWLDRMAEVVIRDSLTTEQATILDRLLSWDRVNRAESIEPTIFIRWLEWAQYNAFSSTMRSIGFPYQSPNLMTGLNQLFETCPSVAYERIHETQPDLSAIFTKAFIQAFDELIESRGTDIDTDWQWWKVNGSTINHLLNVPALNLDRLKVDGSNYSPNAIRNSHGPSWRMVVEMTRPVKAWGVYPGGQSGNPASKNYDAFVKNWADGTPFELTLFTDAESAVQATGLSIMLQSN
jgi:penicillin amidase